MNISKGLKWKQQRQYRTVPDDLKARVIDLSAHHTMAQMKAATKLSHFAITTIINEHKKKGGKNA